MTPSQLDVTGFFRGQLFERGPRSSSTPCPTRPRSACPRPATPAPASRSGPATDIIRRYGEGTGSIAIVLDCSGSMRSPTARGRQKIDEAKEALQAVLAAIPAGTTVSFWIFSQVPKGAEPIEGDPIVLEPERTIKQLWKPAAWNPDAGPGADRQARSVPALPGNAPGPGDVARRGRRPQGCQGAQDPPRADGRRGHPVQGEPDVQPPAERRSPSS